MARRDLATLDRNINQALGRPIQEAFRDGIDCDIIHGGLESGQSSLQSIYAEAATQNCRLGSKLLENETGREFIYSQAGAVPLAAAYMTISAPTISNYLDEIQTGYAWAIGDTSGTTLITTGATPAANYFKDGWMVTVKATGLGYAYPILTSGSHATIIAIALKSGHPIIVATDATTEMSLVKSPFKATIVAPVTTLTAPPAGVPLIAVTAAYFFWAQVKGPCPLFVDDGDTLTIGEPVGSPGTNGTAGTCGIATTTEGHYGRAMTIATADEVALINLDLGL
ncbi:hypothetical protein KAR91_08780 [Candidatus Pacearchaeota archaeon]|nr:hypothetical protein [Candidatus Pacearchaeota archaeon]